MKLAATYTIAVARPKVYAALADPAILKQCIDGCEAMVKTGEDSYDAQLKIGIAGLKGSYTGKVQIRDQRPPEGYTLLVEGKGGPGFVKATARIQLCERGHETELRCEADAQVGGMIAAIGSRLIEPAAKRMLAEFFRKFSQIVSAG